MRRVFFAILSGTSLLVASPLFAQGNSLSRYLKWESQLRDRVNGLFFYPLGADGAVGDVFVRFHVGSNGKPMDVAVQRSSGVPIFDRAAMTLVSRLGRIGPIPSAGGNVNEVVLKLSYGDSSFSPAQSAKLERADRAEQVANEQRNRAVISYAVRTAQGPDASHR